MNEISETKKDENNECDIAVALFLTVTPVLGLIGLALIIYFGLFSWWQVFAAGVMAYFFSLGITAGYHRLLAHRTYQASPLVEIILLLLASATWQGPALKWASDHRRHHRFEDKEGDPYAIYRGFWHAHMGWMFKKEFVSLEIQAPDLEAKPWVRFQQRHYVVLALLMGFGLPTLVGYFLGSAWAGFVIGGLLRTVLNQQNGFIINSFSHMFGRKPYSLQLTARDNHLLALLTNGEGYHNFHHTFQADYRNGVNWYEWDPTKWTIWSLSRMGLTKKLRRTPHTEILRARLSTESTKLADKGVSAEFLEALQKQVLLAQARLKSLRDEYNRIKKEVAEASHVRMQELRAEINLAKKEFHQAMHQWRVQTRRAYA